MPVEHQFDRVGQVVDARGEHDGLRLGDDRPQLRDRRARLQRNLHRPKANQRHVDGRVVGAGETQDAHAITGPHRLARQGGGDQTRAVPQFAVAQGLKRGQQFRRGAAGARVLDELERTVRECGPVRVAPDDGLHDLRQPQPGPVDRIADGLVRPGIGELPVRGVQVGDAAGQPLLASISRHQ